MKAQKNALATLSPEQSNPYAAKPQDFQVSGPDEFPELPGHGQCGNNRTEYENLLRESERSASESNFAAEPEVHPDVNDGGKPHTP